MKKLIDELIPGKFKLKKPIWKYDSLMLDEETVLNEREIEKIKKWKISLVDVESVENEEDELEERYLELLLENIEPDIFEKVSGVTDVVEEKYINQLKNIELKSIDTIHDLENIDFNIDPSICTIPKNLYLKDLIKLPDSYSKDDIRKSTRLASKDLREIFNRIKNGEEFDFIRMKYLVNLKIQELNDFQKELIQGIFLETDHDYLYSHSINVMIFALCIGKELGYKENWLAELGIAALLHDIGMAKIEKNIYMNKTVFAFDDYFDIFKHPILGVDYLTMNLKSRFGGLITLAIYQHHERLDGSGYPKGRKGSGITEYARIIGICDVFEAMTSDRLHRKMSTPLDAYRFINDNRGILFDKKFVDIFFEILNRNKVISLDEINDINNEKRKVIIADSSPFNLWYICHLLRTNNVNVIPVKTVEDAKKHALDHNPDVIMVDSSISRSRGLDLLEDIKTDRRTENISLIYSSDSSNKEDVVKGMTIGINDYLKKPYTFDFVINRLMKYLN